MNVLPRIKSPFQDARTAALMGVGGMLSVQTGSAVSIHLFPVSGTSGTAWLRLLIAALVLTIFVRPRLRGASAISIVYACGLGVMSALMTLCYFGAIARIPLGVASCLEYLGPFAVAIAGSRTRRDFIWPIIAVVGVILVSQPWLDSFDVIGILLGAAAGVFLGGYVLLSQRVGDAFQGFSGLTVAMLVACAVSTPFGAPQALPNLNVNIVAMAIFAAILLPLLPYILEMQALRGMRASAFSTLMSFEPALACLIGFLILGQQMSATQLSGIALVIFAGTAAVRHGGRSEEQLGISSKPKMETYADGH
ncbi:DMT family transporter [Nocardia sp. NPDC058640]|uniref:EamA family transporter n=1 Tax=Nocardia sp. NPDC058640 TaxID=3346571 RepID=UPI00364B59D3